MRMSCNSDHQGSLLGDLVQRPLESPRVPAQSYPWQACGTHAAAGNDTLLHSLRSAVCLGNDSTWQQGATSTSTMWLLSPHVQTRFHIHCLCLSLHRASRGGAVPEDFEEALCTVAHRCTSCNTACGAALSPAFLADAAAAAGLDQRHAQPEAHQQLARYDGIPISDLLFLLLFDTIRSVFVMEAPSCAVPSLLRHAATSDPTWTTQ